MAIKEESNGIFNPELITTSHITQAAQIIKSGEETVKPSTIYDVIIDGDRYPPKEIMRIAHRLATGEDIWQQPGGKPTNSLLEKLGFDVMTKSSDFSLRRNYWKIAPDENAVRWNEFYKKGILAVGFKENGSGDLTKYKSLKELETTIKRENSNEAMSLWICCHAPSGDVVFANKGRNTVMGIGVIDGPYEYDDNSDFPHIRKVKWLSNKPWTYIPEQFASEKRKRPSLFRPDTLSKTEMGAEILKVYLDQHPEYEQVFTANNIWPVYEEATYEKLISKVAGIKNSEIADRYFEFLNQIFEKSGVKENDESLFLSTPKDGNMISMTYNQRYVTYLTRDKDGVHCFAMIQRGKETDVKGLNVVGSGNFGGKFENTPPLLAFIKFRITDGNEFNQQLAQLVIDAMKAEMSREGKYYFRYIHKNSHNTLIYTAATDPEFREKLLKDAYENYFETENDEEENENLETENQLNTNMTLNTILFGPPGTGKTYKLQNEYFNKYTERQESKTRQQVILEMVTELSWWEVIGAALKIMGPSLVPDIAKHEFLVAKTQLSTGKTPKATIWNQLQHHTVKDCEFVNLAARSEPQIFTKNKNSVWSLVENAQQEAPQIFEFVNSLDASRKGSFERKNYMMTTFHQNFSYEDFIEGIKPRITDDEESLVTYEIQKGLFYRACEQAVQLAGYPSISACLEDTVTSRKEKLSAAKPFAFFIDEINRANVSSVFGELITLLEDDKRLGAENEITDIKLPYSKSGFGVPMNLHVIGTMNTADRSVESLDTALRRRFSFMEMAPRYDLEELNAEFAGETLGAILATINKRIEKLLDKDHLIGHSYFIGVGSNMSNLKSVFRNKFLPLLQEYFFGDFSKIGLVLGEGFFEESSDSDDTIFANFRDVDISEHSSRIIYKLKDPDNMSDKEFEEALNTLMKK